MPGTSGAHLRAWAPAAFWLLANAALLLLLEGGSQTTRLAALGLALSSLVALPGLLAARRRRLEETGLGQTLSGRLASDLATSFGAGYAPKAPGTWGSLSGLPVAALLARASPGPRAAILVLLVLASLAIAERYMRGRHARLDPQEVVLDETIGCAIACAFVPFDAVWAPLAFVAFRAFDIAKPGPVGWVDRRIKTPSGIMLDDVVAGLLAGALLFSARRLLGLG
jgi:phosphatidylglycerophosphatase A